ncbi:MAG: hypothetical protein KGI50_03180 [Patescibacteria group bacterium]|nr:hypothetical protein [Patescibacteria group bacterium]MDE2438294.1 hypothetical protein [Patescibacteria group bacterium]
MNIAIYVPEVLVETMELFDMRPHSPTLNYNVKGKEAMISRIEAAFGNMAYVSHLDGLTLEGHDFCINVRPSSTEDLLRVHIEAHNKALLNTLTRRIEEMVHGVSKGIVAS